VKLFRFFIFVKIVFSSNEKNGWIEHISRVLFFSVVGFFIIIFKNPEGSRAEPFKINGKNGEKQI